METDAVLTLLQEVAQEVVVPRFRALASEEIHEKGPGDLVTVADREAEQAITQALERAYPEALVLGEEATAADPSLLDRFRAADHAFTLDPVDGTKNFVRGSADHAVMVAELLRGEVVRSWIWQPQHERAYVAERGAGAWCNGTRLVRPPVGDRLRGVTSRGNWLGRALGAMQALELTWVCCGVDYPKVVEGAADYALYRRAKPWDHAPGSLLLSESGGYVGTFGGAPYRPQGPPPKGLVTAADEPTYRLVQGLVDALPGLWGARHLELPQLLMTSADEVVGRGLDDVGLPAPPRRARTHRPAVSASTASKAFRAAISTGSHTGENGGA